MVEVDSILDFWLGELDPHGKADPSKAALWWGKSAGVDQDIRDRFQQTHKRAMAGELDHWCDHARGRLAWLILLDQFSRNMYRDRAEMYDADALTIPAVHAGIAKGQDRELQTDEVVFFYMPLMHSEALADQQACVDLFTDLKTRCPEPAREGIANNVDFAIQHLEIVKRFNRFPHRNAILGRANTAEEDQFLKQPGSSF